MSAMRFSPLHKNNDDAAADERRPIDDGREGDLRGNDEVRQRDMTEPRRDAIDSERRDRVRPVPTDGGIEKRRIAPRATQFGSGLCGYLAALGSYVLIAAVVHAVVTATGTGHKIANALDGARGTQPTAVNWSGAIALLVLAFVACLIGGYVCGTMARTHGLRNGLSVWLWAAVAAVVASLIVELSSTKYAALYQFDIFPRIHVGSWHGSSGAIITAIIIALAGLIGALVGASIGVAAHRRVRVLETDAAFRSRA